MKYKIVCLILLTPRALSYSLCDYKFNNWTQRLQISLFDKNCNKNKTKDDEKNWAHT
jgi:hypothetical protein